ncbi:trimeric autotransporter adhesin Knh, partial [Ursidibacter sp. B-7004-1]
DATTPNGVNSNGTVAAPVDGNSFLNATSVVNAINNAAFNVTIASDTSEFTDQEGKDNAQVKAGSELVLKSGKNLIAKQDGTNITFATKEEVDFNKVTLSNGTAPTVNLVNEAAKPATNNADAPTSALNITSADGKPTQITGVGSTLNTTTVPTQPNTAGNTAPSTATLVDLANATNPNSAATVGDLQNMGWVVSAAGNNYTDAVKNANEVKFVGDTGVTVTGETKDNIREIKIAFNAAADAGTVTTNPNGTATTTNTADAPKVATTNDVVNAINNSGWTTKPTKVLNVDGSEVTNPPAEVVNPGDAVNYVDGNGTTANVTVTKGQNGQPDTFSVSY